MVFSEYNWWLNHTHDCFYAQGTPLLTAKRGTIRFWHLKQILHPDYCKTACLFCFCVVSFESNWQFNRARDCSGARGTPPFTAKRVIMHFWCLKQILHSDYCKTACLFCFCMVFFESNWQFNRARDCSGARGTPPFTAKRVIMHFWCLKQIVRSDYCKTACLFWFCVVCFESNWQFNRARDFSGARGTPPFTAKRVIMHFWCLKQSLHSDYCKTACLFWLCVVCSEFNWQLNCVPDCFHARATPSFTAKRVIMNFWYLKQILRSDYCRQHACFTSAWCFLNIIGD
jgi:hypothetical protein